MNELLNKIAGVASAGITCIKNADNPYFNSKYADLQTVVEALKEPLKKAGLTYMFRIDQNQLDGARLLDVVLFITDGNEGTIAASFPVVNMADAQKIGQGITYAKRYLLTTVFNVIAEEDDDGNSASNAKPEPKMPKRAPSMLNPAKPEAMPMFPTRK